MVKNPQKNMVTSHLLTLMYKNTGNCYTLLSCTKKFYKAINKKKKKEKKESPETKLCLLALFIHFIVPKL